eukprot:5982838-Amphidinium_carterae.2
MFASKAQWKLGKPGGQIKPSGSETQSMTAYVPIGAAPIEGGGWEFNGGCTFEGGGPCQELL